MADIVIRQADTVDMSSILPLWRELMEFHASLDPYFTLRPDAENNFKKFLLSNLEEKEKNHIVLAEADGEVVGYMMGLILTNPPVFELKQYGEIMDACVSPQHRRSQIGEQLFQAMKNWFQSKGLTRIDINAAATNRVSNSFWKKMGFRPYLNRMVKEL